MKQYEVMFLKLLDPRHFERTIGVVGDEVPIQDTDTLIVTTIL